MGYTDVLGMQEVHKTAQRSNVAAIKSSTLGVYIAPKSADGHMASYPIVYDAAMLSFVSGSYRHLGSVPGLSDRYAVYVKFKVKSTGLQFYFVNTHLPPSVESGGKPSSNTDMISAYKKLGANLKTLVIDLQKSNLPIFVVGDFNVNYRYDKACTITWFPCYLFKSVNTYSAFQYTNLAGISSSQGTHGTGSRLIDYVFSWKHTNVTVNSISIIGGSGDGWGGSDHKPSLAKVTIRK